MNVLRAMQAVELLTRIRREAPELWKQIQQFVAKQREGRRAA